ncbi:MAG: hypothetical protein ACI8X5_001829 [Planctomycetota bacterium]|jgi:hypothetical protein
MAGCKFVWRVIVIFLCLGFGSPSQAQSFDEILVAAQGHSYDRFGCELAADGDRLLVSAPSLDDGLLNTDAGGVYVYEKDAMGWAEVALLRPSGVTHEVGFGSAVALNGDIAVVSAPFAEDQGVATGVVFVFLRIASGWVEIQRLVGSRCMEHDRFGTSISLTSNTLVVGAPGDDAAAPGAGAAYVFDYVGSSWSEAQILGSPTPYWDDKFGSVVASDGGIIAIGSPWHSGELGQSLGLPRSGAVNIFERSEVNWQATVEIESSSPAQHQHFGQAIALEGNTLVVGTPGADVVGPFSGKAEVFERTSYSWSAVIELIPESSATYDRFGYAVAIDGGLIAVGAPWSETQVNDAGVTWLYARSGASYVEWGQLSRPSPEPHAALGMSISIASDYIAIGSPLDSSVSTAMGSALVWKRNDMPLFGTFCSNLDCPCGNSSPAGGCSNSTGGGAQLSASGTLSLTQNDLHVWAAEMPPDVNALLLMGSSTGLTHLGDGMLCISQGSPSNTAPLLIGGVRSTGASGQVDYPTGYLGAANGFLAGETGYFQLIYRDSSGPCSVGMNLTNGLALTMTP